MRDRRHPPDRIGRGSLYLTVLAPVLVCAQFALLGFGPRATRSRAHAGPRRRGDLTEPTAREYGAFVFTAPPTGVPRTAAGRSLDKTHKTLETMINRKPGELLKAYIEPGAGIASLARPQLTHTGQGRLSETESDELDAFVKWCGDNGIDTSRSAAVRTFILAGLRAWRAEVDESE